MDDPQIEPVAVEDQAQLLALNNAHALELSWLTPASFGKLLAQAFHARRVGTREALLIALDQEADYGSQNFLWFRTRYRRFIYVDRVVVDRAARGRGLARRLYDDLFGAARACGHELVCCEVNSEPPNPASDAFHAALGFEEVGAAELADGEKRVRYFVKRL